MWEKSIPQNRSGGVILNLINEKEVRKASNRLWDIQGCEALLVQEMVQGDRELVCGLTRDVQFGPCVMFGIGGILIEVLQDVVFRVAPFTLWDAQEMVRGIRNKKIIESFMGQFGVDIDELSQILVTLGEIGLKYEDVREKESL